MIIFDHTQGIDITLNGILLQLFRLPNLVLDKGRVLIVPLPIFRVFASIIRAQFLQNLLLIVHLRIVIIQSCGAFLFFNLF